jgi:hypothetical protein
VLGFDGENYVVRWADGIDNDCLIHHTKTWPFTAGLGPALGSLEHPYVSHTTRTQRLVLAAALIIAAHGHCEFVPSGLYMTSIIDIHDTDSRSIPSALGDSDAAINTAQLLRSDDGAIAELLTTIEKLHPAVRAVRGGLDMLDGGADLEQALGMTLLSVGTWGAMMCQLLLQPLHNADNTMVMAVHHRDDALGPYTLFACTIVTACSWPSNGHDRVYSCATHLSTGGSATHKLLGSCDADVWCESILEAFEFVLKPDETLHFLGPDPRRHHHGVPVTGGFFPSCSEWTLDEAQHALELLPHNTASCAEATPLSQCVADVHLHVVLVSRDATNTPVVYMGQREQGATHETVPTWTWALEGGGLYNEWWTAHFKQSKWLRDCIAPFEPEHAQMLAAAIRLRTPIPGDPNHVTCVLSVDMVDFYFTEALEYSSTSWSPLCTERVCGDTRNRQVLEAVWLMSQTTDTANEHEQEAPPHPPTHSQMVGDDSGRNTQGDDGTGIGGNTNHIEDRCGAKEGSGAPHPVRGPNDKDASRRPSGHGSLAQRAAVSRASDKTCNHCGVVGHWRTECPERMVAAVARAAAAAKTLTDAEPGPAVGALAPPRLAVDETKLGPRDSTHLAERPVSTSRTSRVAGTTRTWHHDKLNGQPDDGELVLEDVGDGPKTDQVAVEYPQLQAQTLDSPPHTPLHPCVTVQTLRPLKSLRGRESTVGNGRSSTHSTCDAHAIPPCSTAPGETGSVTARASDNMAYYESAAARLGEAQGYPRRPSLLPQPKHDARGPHHQPPPTRGGHSRAIVHHARHGVNKNDYDEDSPLLLIGVLSMGNTTAPVGTNTAHTGSGYDDVEVHTAHHDCPYEVITALKHMSPPGDTPAGSM